MRNRTFISVGHANQYLSGSIILYDNAPIYISQVFRHGNKWTLESCPSYYYNSPDRYDQAILITDKKIDMTPFPMGYVNVTKLGSFTKAVRTFRTPVRASKIGLYSGNFIAPETTNRDLLYSKALFDTIVGNFPSFDEALEMVSSNHKKVAFSRYFAINEDKSINYLHFDKPVGTVKNDHIKLDKDMVFLSELLEKEMTR